MSTEFLNGTRILDGGLATELEAKGIDLDHPLWSAYILQQQPEAIRRVHLDYLEAGAQCIIAAGYQASLQGMEACGFSARESRDLLQASVMVAQEARAQFLAEMDRDSPSFRESPSIGIAAGIGPYGAYLADGSEFRGRYGLTRQELMGFHRERMELLWAMEPDLLAFETFPCHVELEAVLALLSEYRDMGAWISFSCRDGEHINDGTPIRDAASACAEVPGVRAVGVNCTAPQFVSPLIDQIRGAAPHLPVIVYPNSGETYDGRARAWVGTSDPLDFGRSAVRWIQQGAAAVGGCCRTSPKHIREIRQALEAIDPLA